MARRQERTEQTLAKLREAEILLTRGMGFREVAAVLGIHGATYRRWRKEYKRVHSTSRQTERLKEVEKENSRIRMQYPT